MILVCLAMGCRRKTSGDRVELVPVTGTLTYRGEAATGARITFHPIEGPGFTANIHPHATADPLGHFRMTSYEVDDGAPVGVYEATVIWPDRDFSPRSVSEIEEIQGGDFPDKLKGRYSSPNTIGKQVTVASPSTDLEPIDLK